MKTQLDYVDDVNERMVTEVTEEEYKLIVDISKRANKELGLDVIQTQMTLSAIHTSPFTNRLNFKKLLAFKKKDFTYDLLGMSQFVDHAVGALRYQFAPLCMKQKRL